MILINFYKDFFSLNLKDYPNIAIDLEINKLLFCLFLGVMVAAIFMNYKRHCTITLIKRLLRYDAISIDKAKSISDLGIKSSHVKTALKSSRITKIISSDQRKEYTYEEYSKMIKQKGFKEEKIDVKSEKLYIKENMLDEAKSIIEGNHPTFFSTLLFCVLIFAISICTIFLMPGILNFINNLLAK